MKMPVLLLYKQFHQRALSGFPRKLLLRLSVAALATQPVMAQVQSVLVTNQLPQGGFVAAGQANIKQSGNVMNIDQATQKAIINWQEFNVGADAKVNFNQPGADSATLNRVLSNNPSQIFGQIVAPGQVILINPNGAYFAPSASVDVGGLIATTHELADKDFLDGNYQFKRNGATGKIINDGELKAKLDGYIALMAPEVRNQGVIVAERGTVVLAAGEHIQLDFGTGNKLQGITVTEQDLDAQIENKHAIFAEGGLVILSARATAELRASVIKNSGQIVASAGANTVTQKGGQIILEGNTIEITEGAELIATGPKGGGEVLIGGDWQGGANEERRVFDNPDQIHQATTVTVQSKTKIDVSATDNGDGGTVVVWSDVKNPDSVTTAQGEILAKGGEAGGDGGQIETSGAVLTVDGLLVDGGAVSGRAGLWLLDPYDYVIDSAAAQTIGAALATTDVTVTTTLQNSAYGAASSQGVGNILLSYPIIKFQNAQLTTLSLKANRDINMNGWSITGRLNLVMWSDTDGVSGGAVSNLGNITSFGGFVWVGGGSASTQFEGIDVPNGPTTGTSGAPLTVTGSINTYGGDIFIWSGGGASSNALKFDGTTAVLSSGFIEISAEDANGVSAGDITIRANEFEFLSFPIGQKPQIATSGGSVAILPSVTGGSFGQTIRTSMFEFEGELGGLQIGAAANTADLFFDAVISPPIAGPVSLFGNTVNVNQTITTTGSANASVSITGSTINLGANIIGTGAHVLDGDVVIQGTPGVERIIEGTGVLFGSTVDGTNLHSLSIVGDALFMHSVGASVPLSNLRVSGSTELQGDVNTIYVNTIWLQQYSGPVTLFGNVSVSSDTIVFRSTVDGLTSGIDHLQANAQTSLIFDGDVGGTFRLSSVAVSGPTLLGGDIATTGSLSFTGETTLTDHSTLTGSGVRLAAVTLDGHELNINESGVGLISGVISDGLAPGGALTMSGPGVLTLTANGTYTGATTISNGALVISHDAPTTNSSGFKGPGKLIIRSVSDDFNSQFFSEGWNFGPDLSELTIGRFDKSADGVNDADVIITRAITLAGDVFIYGAHVYLNGDFTVLGSGNLPISVRLQASGVVSTKGIEAPKSIIINNSVGSGHVFVSGSIRAGVDFSVLAGGTIFLEGDVTTTGGQLYDAPVVVSGSRELSGTSISFLSVNGTILGQDNLDITGDTYFLGEVGIGSALRRLSVDGNTVVGGNIRTLDSLVLSDTTILTGNRTLTGVGINLDGVSLNGNRLTVNEGGVGTISGVVSDGSTTGGSLTKTGVGTLTLTSNSTYKGATTISSGILVFSNDSPQTSSSGFSGAGRLVIEPTSEDFTSAFSTTGWGFDSSLGGLRVGKFSSANGIGDVDFTIAGQILIAGSVELFGGSVIANHSITVTGSSSAVYIVGSDSVSTGDVNATGSVSIYSLGAINVAGSLLSSDDVTIWSEGDVNLTGTLVSGVYVSISSQGDIFSSAVTATEHVFITNSDGGGDIDLAGVLNAGGWLQVGSIGTIVLGADVTTVGSQTYSGSVRLSGDRTLDASYAVFLSSVNATLSGQEALTIRGDAAFAGSVGGTVPLKSLSVSGTTRLGNNITTTGAQIFSGLMILPEAADLPVTATTDRTLTGHGISLSAIELEGHALKIAESGLGTISGVVSDGSVSGGGLLKFGTGTLTLTANGTYTGATTISSGRLVLSNDAPSTASPGFTGAGELVIEPASDDFVSDFSTASWVFGADLGGLTIGKSSSADGTDDVNIVVPEPISIAGNILFTGGGVTVSGSLAATGNFSSIRIDARQDIAVSSVEAVNRIDLFSIASNIDVNGRLSAQTVEIRSRDGLSSIVGTINADRLYMTGPSSISAVISTTSDQTYFDFVTFAGHSSLSAPNVTFFSQVNGAAAGQQDLTITGNTLLNSPVGSITALRSLRITGDIQLAGNVTAVEQIEFAGNTSLVGDRSLTGSGISLAALTLNGHTLTVDESSFGTISGVVSDGVTLGGSLITTGFGQLRLTANSMYTGATVIAGGELVLANDAPTTQSSGFSGSGSLVIEPAGNDFANTFSTAGWTFAQNLGRLTIGKTSGFDGVADAGIVIASPISIDGEVRFRGAAITTGSNSIRSRSSGVALEASGDVTVAAIQSDSRMRLWSYTGNIHVTDQLLSMNEISLGAFGLVSINGAVSADSLFVSSDAFIAADVATTQTQQYQGHVVVADSITLRASEVLFINRVDGFVAGQQALTIDANARFYREVGASTALKSLSVSGSTLIGTIIKTTEEQTFTGPSQLLPYVLDARLSGSSVTFLSTVDADAPASQFLIINGNARFDAAVGDTARLQGLYVSGSTRLGGNISATGGVELVGMTTLTGSHTVTGLGIRLGAVNLEGHVLTVSESGSGLISGVVADASVAGGGLTMTGSGVVTLSANGTYTGPTVIANGGLVFSNDSPQTSSSGFSGAGQLFIQPTSTDFASDFSTADWVFDQSLGGLTIGTIMSANGRNDVGLTIAAPVLITGYFSAFGSTITGSQITTTTGSSSIVYIVASNSLVIDTVSAAGSINIVNHGSGSLSFAGSMTSAGDVSIFSQGSISAGAVTTAGNISIRNNRGAGDIQVRNSLDSGGWIEVSSSGTIVLDADVISIGGQNYTGEVVLSGDRALQGTYVRFYSTIDGTTSGQEALSVTGDAIFAGHVGSTVPLKSLNVSLATSLGGDITTVGSQTYNGLTTLARTSNPGRMLSGTGINLGAIELEGEVLTIGESGAGTISGVVQDGSLSGGGLTKSGSGTLTLLANGAYTGATTIASGTLVLSNDAPSTRSTWFSGAGGLVIEPVADDFTQAFSSEGWSFGFDLGFLRVGHRATGYDGVNDADVAIDDALTLNGSLEIFGRNITLSDDLSTAFGSVELMGSGALATQAIEASALINIRGDTSVVVNGDIDSGAFTRILSPGPVSLQRVTSSAFLDIGSQRVSASRVTIGGGLVSGGSVTIWSASSITLAGDVQSAGDQSYQGNVLLAGANNLTALSTANPPVGRTVTFSLTVEGTASGQESLNITGDARFLGDVGVNTPLQSLLVTGTTLLGGDVVTTGGMELTGPTTLTGSHTLTGVGIDLAAVNLEGHVLTVNEGGSGLVSGVVSDGSTTGGSLTKTGVGTLTLTSNSTYTGATTISSGELVLSNDSPQTSSSGFSGAGQLVIEPASDDFTSTFSTTGWTFAQNLGYLRVGKTNASSYDGVADADILINDAVSIAGSIELFGGSVIANHSITATGSSSLVYIIGGDSVSTADVTAPGSIVIHGLGAINVSGSLRSSDDVTIRSQGDVRLTGALVSGGGVSVTSEGDISISAVTANEHIYIANSAGGGDIDLTGALNVSGWLHAVSAGTIVLGADVTTVGSQTYSGSVRLSGDRTLDAVYIAFDSSVNGTVAGQQGLTIIGEVGFLGNVGGNIPLSSLSVSGTTYLGNNITTMGTQIFSGLIRLPEAADMPVTATTDRTLTGHGISLSAIELEGHALKIAESGLGTISGVVSDGSVSGGGLLKFGAGTLTLTANGTYTGATTVLSGLLVVSNDAPATRSSGFSGAGRLVIEPAANDFTQSFSTEGWTFLPNLGGLRIGKQAQSTDAVADVDVIIASPLNIAGHIQLFGQSVITNQSITATGSASNVWIHVSDGLSIADVTATGYVWLVNKGAEAIRVAGSLQSDDYVEVFSINSSISVASIMARDNIAISSLRLLSDTSISVTGPLDAGGWVGVSSAGTIALGADISSVGNQTYLGKVVLTGDSQLAAPIIHFSSTVDGSVGGQEALSITGDAVFAGDVGVNTALKALSVMQATSLGGDIASSGAVVLTGLTTLAGSHTLTGVGIDLGAVNLEGHVLTVNEGGSGLISGVVADASAAGGGLTKTGAGILTLRANSTYTGPTMISSGSLVLSNDSPSSASSGFSGAGQLFIQPNSASFTNTFLLSDWMFSSNLGGLTIGKSGNSSDVVVDRDVTIAGTVTLIGGDITLTHSLRTGVNQDIVLATSGDFINNKGTLALGTSGTGRWIVYADDPDDNVYGDLDSSNEAIWNETYDTLAPSAVPTGNRYVFAGGAINAVTLTTTDATKIYGESIDLSGYYVLSAVGYPGESGVYLPTTVLGSSTLTDVFLSDPMFVSSKAESSASIGTSLIAAIPGVAKSGFIVTYNNIGLLTVVARPITITADALQHKTYGGIDPALTYTLEANASGRGLFGSDVFTGELARLPGEDANDYPISQGTLDNSNYSVSFADDVFTIRPKPLMVTAHGKSKVYGDADPVLTYSTDVALVAGDRFMGQLSRLPGEEVGPYGIERNTLTIDDGNGGNNYTLGYTDAQLEIRPRPITLIADTVSKVYGEVDPSLSVSIAAGSLGSVTVSDSLADVVGTPARQSGENVGSYDVLLGSGVQAKNYAITYLTDNDALVIRPKPLMVTAHGKSKVYGDADPVLTYSTDVALVAGDRFMGQLSRLPGEDVGPYGIERNTLTIDDANGGNNYTLGYTDAQLEIRPRPITLIADTVSKVFGETRQVYKSSDHEYLTQSDSLRLPVAQSAADLQVDVSLDASYVSASLLRDSEQQDSEAFCLSATIQAGFICSATVDDLYPPLEIYNYLTDSMLLGFARSSD